MVVQNVIMKTYDLIFFCVEFIMSNIKKNFFNPGSNKIKGSTKKRVDIIAGGVTTTTIEKKDTTFDPVYTPKFSLRLMQTLNTKPNIPADDKKSTIYKKTGKPLKPNVGSLDRIQRLKAAAFGSN